MDAPDAARLGEEIAAADVVHLHFWNDPEAYEFLEADLPAMRLVVWSHVAGRHPPQLVIPELADAADRLVAACPLTLEPGLELEVIMPMADTEPLLSLERAPRETFDVGYIGTVDFFKLHPGYVDMSARVRAPNSRFLVAGSGGGFAELAAQAERLGVRERFEFLGWLRDVPSVLARLDVFGYPLREENTSTGELVLQEAMAAGVPPVVLPHGAPGRIVRHEETGLIAEGPEEYARAIDHLYDHPRERARLGRQAREHARRKWSSARMQARWEEVYGELLERPKRPPGPRLSGGDDSGAQRFVRSLGSTSPQFATSLTGDDQDRVLAAEQEIGASRHGLDSANAGGVLHYRLRYPNDPHLRLWAGLVLREQGRRALAAGEFAGALRLGLDESRVSPYLQPEVVAALATVRA